MKFILLLLGGRFRLRDIILDFMREIRFGREGKELYDDKWNPWQLADKIMWDGEDLQDADWHNHPGFKENLAIFCHGGSSTAFLARVLNQPFPYFCELLHFSHTGITVLRFDRTPGRLSMPILELLNDDRHLNGVV